MSRFAAVAVLVGLLLANAEAAQVKAVKDRIDKAGRAAVLEYLKGQGFTDVAEQDAILDACDEDVLVNEMIDHSNYSFFAAPLWLKPGDMSKQNAMKVRMAIATEKKPLLWYTISNVASVYPAEERSTFSDKLREGYLGCWIGRQVGCRITLKYMIEGKSLFEVTAMEALEMLLAPEPMALVEERMYKELLLGHCVKQARIHMNKNGKSFVVKDGVNPLATALQPVVDAMNAPLCAGLEKALRDIGFDAADANRDALVAWGVENKAKVVAGDEAGMQSEQRLGKLAVVMGVDGYNAFVDAYNGGK